MPVSQSEYVDLVWILIFKGNFFKKDNDYEVYQQLRERDLMTYL